jgi:pimeloyl-ACP methyl ester carboxylesterase
MSSDALSMQTLDVNGLRMQVAVQGSGPLVLLCHGFPELWISWRAQLEALAAAGYRVVAPDMRG